MGRLKQHKVYAAENKGDSIIVQRDYRYDQRTGHLLQIDDLKRGSTHYQYDAVEQLTSVEGLHPEKFVYDPAGNLLEASGEPCEVVDNRLLMQGDRKFEYDLRGNLSLERRGKGGQIKTHYHYNALNQLVEVVKQRGAETRGTYQYQYDPFGRRVAKQDEFGTTHFLWNGDQLLSEDRAHIHKVYVYDPGTFKPLALLQDDQIYYFKLDHLGTPQEMVDKEGELVWSVKYKAFGQTLLKYVEKVNCPFRFQGQYYDEETGLHYNRHRYYDPSVARFISQDPIGLLGGVNLYRYVPNPIGWVDPLGLTAKNDDCDTAVVAKATDLPVVKPGTPEWKNAVDSMSGLGKGKLNVRTETAADAQALLKESRGNMNRYKNYTNDSYKKGYETHNAQNPRELGAGNDLQHLKWKDGKSGGHVYYDKPN